jgi:DNA-binding LacI/PurR family transcriptional regulator
MTRSITISDVARAANVSVTTVSRILNDKPDVAENTRQRVLQVIDQLGYAPHAQAQSLAAGKGRMIAVMYPPGDTEFSQPELGFFTSAAQAAREHGFFVNLITDLFTESGLLNVYRGAQMDGVILTQIHMEDWRVDLLRNHNYPFVMIGRSAANEGLSYIDLDSEEAIFLAFQHLVELGHRQIAFINFPTATRTNGSHDYGPTVRSRNGFERACQEYGLESLYRIADPSFDALYSVTTDLVAERPGLTAIVTRHGAPVVGTFRALRDLDKRIPDDFSVVGVVTDYLANVLIPSLTAINFPAHELGYQAAQILIGQLTTRLREPNQILLNPELVVRESTGPVTS